MVPRKSGFNQWHPMVRDGEVEQRQLFIITETQFAIRGQVM